MPEPDPADPSPSGGPPGSGTRLRPFDRRLLDRAAQVRWILAADVAAGLVGTLLLLLQVTLIAGVIAQAAQGHLDQEPVGALAALATVVLARAGLAQVVETTGRRAATRVMSALRLQLLDRRLLHGGRGQSPVDSAALATASVQGVDGLETYFARYLPQVVLAFTVPVAVLVWSAAVDIESAVIMAITLPVIPIFMVLIGRSAASRARANWQALVGLSAHFLDVVRGLPTLRAFNRGAAQVTKIQDATEQYRRTTMSTLRLAFLSGLVLDLATTLSTALVAVTLGVRLVNGGIGLRPALTVLLLVPELYAPIRQVGALFHASSDGLAAAEQILEVLDEKPDEADAGTPGRDATEITADPALAPIRLEGVTVRYPGRAGAALDRVDLEIHPGETLAIVGPSGAGKTTLGRVLLGLVAPTQGTMLVGARPLTTANLESWRRCLAWAPQRPTLLHASVAANIALGTAELDLDAIERAARAAGAHEFIVGMREGYASTIGGGGRGLSAGQRQRLGLARALMREAPLLVLDEPTAHLDRLSADRVAEVLATAPRSRTTVVLTHDPRLMAVADRVLAIDEGRLAPLPAAVSSPSDGSS